ncbi:MAG: hypothetical protein ACLUNZ_07595 [Evtepia sp.]
MNKKELYHFLPSLVFLIVLGILGAAPLLRAGQGLFRQREAVPRRAPGDQRLQHSQGQDPGGAGGIHRRPDPRPGFLRGRERLLEPGHRPQRRPEHLPRQGRLPHQRPQALQRRGLYE